MGHGTRRPDHARTVRATDWSPRRILEEYQDCFIDRTRSTGEVWLAERIFNAVLEDPRTHSVGTDALVEALVSSFSFDHTRRLWSLITKVPQSRGDQLRRLDHAAKSNPQVARPLVSHGWRPVRESGPRDLQAAATRPVRLTDVLM